MRWLLICCLAALLAACTSGAGQVGNAPAGTSAEATATQAIGAQSALSPEALTAALTGTASLGEAAAQLAQALGVQPDQVRVRIQDSQCSVCNIESRAKLGSLEGLTVEEAAPLIEANATFWLFVDDIVCEYVLRDAVYTPQACRVAP